MKVFTAAVSWRKVAGGKSQDYRDASATLSGCTVARLEDLTSCFPRPAAVAPLQAALRDPTRGGASGENRLRAYLDRGEGKRGKDDEDDDSKETYYCLPPAPPLVLTGLPPPPPSGPLPIPPVPLPRGPNTAAALMHHVTAFFRPEAVRTCQRCHCRFFVQPALHPADSCKFHKGSYVCRRHPAETKFVYTLSLMSLYCAFYLIDLT